MTRALIRIMSIVSFALWLFVVICLIYAPDGISYFNVRYLRADLVLSVTTVVCASLIALGISTITLPKKD